MGIRSDVFLAFKTDLYWELPKHFKEFFHEQCTRRLTHEQGVAFVFEDIKWYVDSEPLCDFYEWLTNDRAVDARLIEACHDYPESDENNRGDWDDNPWQAYKVTTVSISYNEAGEEAAGGDAG